MGALPDKARKWKVSGSRAGEKTITVPRRYAAKARTGKIGEADNTNEARSERVPATVLDNRLKQRWSHLFKVLNSKAREADAAGHPELGERLRHVAENFYPTKRRQVAPCQAKNDYDATLDAYSQLGQVTRIISGGSPDEAMVRESERVSASVLRHLKSRKPRLTI